ncbi:cytochrome P450 [Amylostereum chailletii]|nr:cytochrome P450 [Amylostereum chailletii]
MTALQHILAQFPLPISLWSIALTFLLIFGLRKTDRLPLPPGPPPKWLTGNLHQLPKVEAWKTYAHWGRQYGPLVLIRVFGRKTLVLNSHAAVLDLLESRSSIYSERPIAWMYKILVERKWGVFNIATAHPRFKIYRKLLHASMNPKVVQGYRALQTREAGVLLRALHSHPDKFISHLRRNAGAVILEIAYGWPVRDDDDYFVSIMEEGFKLQAELTRPGRWLVDVFPILRFIPAWFPGADFQRQAVWYREQLSRLDRIPHQWAMEQINSGVYTESFTSKNMRPSDGTIPNTEEEDIVKWCSAALYAGAADTIVSSMTTFFLLMTLHPVAQQRAQEEIDRVVGTDRLPTMDDREKLPYVGALIKEVLRWSPPAPLGLPHSVTEEDAYQGWRIPKDTMVIANIWALTHDPSVYPDPFAFNPDRFLSSSSSGSQFDPTQYVFGFGRRVCAGSHFAEVSLFLNIASVLAAFSILKPLDEGGKEYDPAAEFTSTITSHPKPFSCRIVSRSSVLEAAVKEE